MQRVIVLMFAIVVSGCQVNNRTLIESKLKSVRDIWSLKTVFYTEKEIKIIEDFTYHEDLLIRSRAISLLMSEIQSTDFVQKRVFECLKNNEVIILFDESGSRVQRNMLFTFISNNEEGFYQFRSAFNLLFEFGEYVIPDLLEFLKMNDLHLARESYAAIERLQQRKMNVPFKQLWKNYKLIDSMIEDKKAPCKLK